MDTIDAMRVFVAVVERNGFSAAADALNLSTAAVTRQIAALEKRLSARLLNRTTRRVSPTSTGATYYQRCVQLLNEFDELEASVGAQALQPAGRLRINAPVSYGISRLAALLPGTEVSTTDEAGISGDDMEALAFAWLAWRTIAGLPGNLPSVTGASEATVLGAIFPANPPQNRS